MVEFLVEARALARDYPAPDGAVMHVLDGIDCKIVAGDRIALVGPSGSGKSTLLHILGGLDLPTKGEVTWPALGERKTLQPERVSFVFQTPSLFPPLTVIQNVTLPLILAGDEVEAHTRAMSVLEAFDLDGLAEKLPEELSGGQAQRISMARALVIGPSLILADEPTGQLDSATARRFLDTLLERLAVTRSALVIATHDRSVAERMSMQWIIDHGRLSSNPKQNGTTP